MTCRAPSVPVPAPVGRPALGRLNPTVLLSAAAALLAVGLVLDPLDPLQATIVAAAVAGWLLLAGVRARRAGKLLLFGLTLLLPVFLLAPWIDGGETAFELPGALAVTTGGLAVPARIVARGLFCLLVGAGLATAADPTTLALGLSRVPLLPRLLVVMTVQTLRWSTVLVEESLGIGRAIVLRGGGGPRGVLALARSLPLVWLPRVIARAERVTAAMEVRGYGGELPEREPPGLGAPDLVGLCAVALLALAATVVRSSS